MLSFDNHDLKPGWAKIQGHFQAMNRVMPLDSTALFFNLINFVFMFTPIILFLPNFITQMFGGFDLHVFTQIIFVPMNFFKHIFVQRICFFSSHIFSTLLHFFNTHFFKYTPLPNFIVFVLLAYIFLTNYFLFPTKFLQNILVAKSFCLVRHIFFKLYFYPFCCKNVFVSLATFFYSISLFTTKLFFVKMFLFNSPFFFLLHFFFFTQTHIFAPKNFVSLSTFIDCP